MMSGGPFGGGHGGPGGHGGHGGHGGGGHGKPNVPSGYYWRDYTGHVPDDAVPGGHDSSHKPTYIGQAYIAKIGILPGTIWPGQVGIRGAHGWKGHYSDIGVKILCGSNWNSFSWENATASTMHTTTIGKTLVIGGYENGNKLLNVGRVMHKGQLIVGKVISYQAGNAPCHYVDGEKEVNSPTYQVLVYYN